MMQINRIIITAIALTLFLSCKHQQGVIEISHVKTDNPVTVKFYEDQRVGEIRLPVQFTIKNKTNSEKQIFKYTYKYQNGHRFPAVLKIRKNDDYVKLKTNENTIISSGKSEDFYLITRHRIDIDDSIQKRFSILKNRLVNPDNKELKIKSLESFKNEFPDFFEFYTRKDSLMFVFYELDKNKKPIYERKVIPIKF